MADAYGAYDCPGCEDSENAPHAYDCTRYTPRSEGTARNGRYGLEPIPVLCKTRYGYELEGKPVICGLAKGHDGSHVDSTHSAPATLIWESLA